MQRWLHPDHPMAGAMSTILDSTAEFSARAVELGLGEQVAKMKDLNIKSFADLATSTDWAPGSGHSEVFINDVVVPILGDKDHLLKNCLRRLFLESFTLFAGDLKARTEHRGEDVPLKLPTIERESRFRALQARLPGTTLTGELEPSTRLIDLAHAMFEDNVVRYIEWPALTKRSDEILGKTKDERVLKLNAAGQIVEKNVAADDPANLSTDYLLHCALRRRSLALDIANLMAFETHELWVGVLMAVLTQDPPPGYERAGLSQVRFADQELWKRAAPECRDGVRPRLGARPLETAFKMLMYSPEVRLLLLPLRGSGASSSRSSAAPQQVASRSTREQQLEREVASLKRERETDNAGKGNRQGRQRHPKGRRGQQGQQNQQGSKGKGKTTQPMPAGLAGKSGRTRNNDPICYNYNLPAGCTGAPDGGRCNRGMHVCAEPGCEGAHPLGQHRR